MVIKYLWLEALDPGFRMDDEKWGQDDIVENAGGLQSQGAGGAAVVRLLQGSEPPDRDFERYTMLKMPEGFRAKAPGVQP